MANWETKKWHGIEIKRGQFISSIENLRFMHGVGKRSKRLTIKQVRTLLSRLKTTNELASESTNLYTLFSIVNWDKYQCEDGNPKGNRDGNQNGKQRASGRATTKECKKEKKVKNKYGSDGIVLLTLEEHEKLTIRFGENRLNELIEKMNNGIAAKPSKYKYDSHYHALLNWAEHQNSNSYQEKPKINAPICDGIPSA